ncbi:MAG: diguanylate cyclase, partial [Motiliproteus sp.]
MFKRIDLKIFAVIGTVVTLGLVVLVLFYAEREEQATLAQNKRTLLNVLDSTHQGLRTLMLSGYGDAGQLFVESLKNMDGFVDLRVIHPDGSQAFVDNTRIDQVNQALGFIQFFPRTTARQEQVLAATNSSLQRALETGEPAEYYDVTQTGERLYTLLYPVKQEQGCMRCHPPEQPVLGVIKLTSSLRHVDQEIAASRNLSLWVLSLSVLLTMLAISVFVRRVVVSPIQAITVAMRAAASGDLSQRLMVPKSMELGRIVASFNHKIAELEMLHSGLHDERNKLSTIILGAQEGMVATDAAGHVVLVNPAAEKLLKRSYEQIAREGLTALFEDSQWPQLLSQARLPGSPVMAEIHQPEQILHIQLARIANDKGELIGTAVLMRDITQEEVLRKGLEHQSRTDALTGLFNRRHFDQELAAEFRLSRRYLEPLSLVLFDIDHFKRVNDDCGHEQGDRVLQQVATAAWNHIR